MITSVCAHSRIFVFVRVFLFLSGLSMGFVHGTFRRTVVSALSKNLHVKKKKVISVLRICVFGAQGWLLGCSCMCAAAIPPPRLPPFCRPAPPVFRRQHLFSFSPFLLPHSAFNCLPPFAFPPLVRVVTSSKSSPFDSGLPRGSPGFVLAVHRRVLATQSRGTGPSTRRRPVARSSLATMCLP